MKDKILMDVYNDFFASSNKNTDFVATNQIDQNTSIDIDTLYITDESKELLKKITSYMSNYNDEDNYINFNITIEGNDKTTLDKITKILKQNAIKYNYINNYKVENISLYQIDDLDTLNEKYQNNGIISLSELSVIETQNTSYKNKFFYNLKEKTNDKKITIIMDNKENLKKFFENDTRLNQLFSFHIVCSKPSTNDIYNELLNKLNKEIDTIKLLDYITSTYESSTIDYTSYINDLYKYILFNNDVPKIEKIKTNEEVFKELNELVGLKKVKDTLNDLVNLITLKAKTQNDLKINNINLHMVFLGNPGTGKTTVARLIADILYNLKYIKQNKLIEVSSKDLVAEYVGQTAVKTTNVINKALGGILFIDEAYALSVKNNENSFNAECIATLIKAMEDYRDNLVVIFAGYTKEMDDFLNSNSGIVSRIGYTLEFEDYTNDELIQIYKNMMHKSGFIIDNGIEEIISKLIDEKRTTKNFGNARFIRNLYEKTIINHASNTKNNKSKKVLKTITKKDIENLTILQ